VTEQERFDRETLLKRAAAVAGAVYLAPVLTSSAAAGADGCLNFACSKKKRKWKKKHRKKCQASGAACDCPAPGSPCANTGCACTHGGECCDALEQCGTNCGCFLNGHRQNPGHCIRLHDLCSTYQGAHGTCPGGNDSECAAGLVCFSSCCDCSLGYPPLCAECCHGRTAGVAHSPRGAGELYLRAEGGGS
jgi:hypothetical protein